MWQILHLYLLTQGSSEEVSTSTGEASSSCVHTGPIILTGWGRTYICLVQNIGIRIKVIMETFIQHKIDKDPLMCWNPKRDSPKQGRGHNPVSACQGGMTMVMGKPISPGRSWVGSWNWGWFVGIGRLADVCYIQLV